MHDQVRESPSTSVGDMVSVAVSVVPDEASVTEPVSSESAIVGASLAASTVTVAAKLSETELS